MHFIAPTNTTRRPVSSQFRKTLPFIAIFFPALQQWWVNNVYYGECEIGERVAEWLL